MKKYIIAIVTGLIILGLVVGFNNNIDLSNVVKMSFSFKYFVYLLILLISGITLSFIGIPLFLFLLLIEIISCGVVTSYFILAFSFKGLFFSLIYFLVFKIIYWFFLLLIGFYSLKLIKNNYLYLFKRFKENKNNSKLYLKKMLVISSFMLFLNLLTVLFGNRLIVPLANYLFFK